jgi:acetolactate synthase I/II/III large subunit
MLQKLSDYIADFLAAQGIRHVFVVTGGASIHILHSLHDRPGTGPICPHHEQAGAMAADGYARATGGLGCAVGTSGPGATNLITGIAGAWFDSIPVLYLTGQVTTFRLKGQSGVRQFGFQETEIIPMVRPITKYCVQLRDPRRIRYELEKAVHIARSGRPGPVLIDIPDDLQRAFVETDDLPAFEPDAAYAAPVPVKEDIKRAIELLLGSKRPVLIFGHGIRLSGAVAEARALAERCNVPVMTTWGAKDFFSASDRLNAGTFGTHGTRAGNFVVQNADFVLSIGARLSTRETGSPLSSWARGAHTVVIDIDRAELNKFPSFERELDIAIQADALSAIRAITEAIDARGNAALPDWTPWRAEVADWMQRYPVTPKNARSESTINPYILMEEISGVAQEDTYFFIDTGCAVAWSMQALRLRGSQRTFHDFNNTAMGWALPAAIGGALAFPRKSICCVVGDGSLMMNIQELATLKHHGLPVKVLLLDNSGYSMVRQTEVQWLGGVNVGTSTESGLGFPDFIKLAQAFGFETQELSKSADLKRELAGIFALPGAVFVRIEIPSEKGVIPQVAFGFPIEDSEPYLPREEFIRNMKVAPLPASLNLVDRPANKMSA